MRSALAKCLGEVPWRRVSGKRSQALPRSWCDLPDAPGAPPAGIESLRAVMGSPDGMGVAHELITTLCDEALAVGNAEELGGGFSCGRTLFITFPTRHGRKSLIGARGKHGLAPPWAFRTCTVGCESH